MATANTNMHIADYYYSMLESLNDNTKLYLVKKLTDSLFESSSKRHEAKATDKDKLFESLAGIWADDPEADAIADIVAKGRKSNTTREIIPFD
jgi:hypothetical protein